MIGRITDDRAGLADAFAAGAVSGMPTGPVEHVETHANHVFLVGDTAYKLKKPLQLPFLDYSTVDRRREMCAREVALNRRTAPSLYLRVATVTAEPGGGHALDGDGAIVDHVVVMRRFDQSTLFDRATAAGTLDLSTVRRLTDHVLAFHDRAERVPNGARHGGGAAGLRTVIEENFEEFRALPEWFAPDRVARLASASARALDRVSPLLDQRLAEGRVRSCHGDLHLKNICLVDAEPTLFDAIEFDDAISVIDVLYDLAFLLMDLADHGLPGHAAEVLSRYMAASREDIDGLAAMPLFVATRACVRAKVAALSPSDPEAKAAEIDGYLGLAERVLRPSAPLLVAIGGPPGCGKSTVARALAPMLMLAGGALHLNSDVIRKRVAGVAPEDGMPPGSYSTADRRAVYDIVLDSAERALAARWPVVIDATFLDADPRGRVERIAAMAGARFVGLWLEVGRAELERRLTLRRGTGDPSDAGPDMLDILETETLAPMGWHALDGESPGLLGEIGELVGAPPKV